jgi:RNA polymerase sigma-70 factor, ECF subfamily
MNSANDHTECALRSSFASGDTEAFRRLVQTYQGLLLRFATRFLCGNAETAKDVVQEAFLRLWGARETFRMDGNVRGWLLKTTHRLCIDHLRRMHSTVGIGEAEPDRRPSPAVQAERVLQSEAVRVAIANLPEGQRAVVVLFVYENLSYEEIAQVLEIPMGTVASRKHQAIATLRESLQEWK